MWVSNRVFWSFSWRNQFVVCRTTPLKLILPFRGTFHVNHGAKSCSLLIRQFFPVESEASHPASSKPQVIIRCFGGHVGHGSVRHLCVWYIYIYGLVSLVYVVFAANFILVSCGHVDAPVLKKIRLYHRLTKSMFRSHRPGLVFQI